MNKKATSENLMQNAIFLILGATAFGIIAYFVANQADNASEWSDYYSKEISKSINLGNPEDVIYLDVHEATRIAKKGKLSLSSIFTFYNKENKICVQLTNGWQSCYSYFNNVDIINPEIKLGLGDEKNTLTFKIEEKGG